MVKLIREGRKKFGFASKANFGSIIDAKIRSLSQNGAKLR